MRLKASILLSLSLLPAIHYGQELSYTHYDTQTGLAGTFVYDVDCDKEGFLWFCTESGVSRFDGTHFRNFTTKDGLPDNEIIQQFVDSKGRIWMAPFRKTICYYYRGTFHNQENDTLLKKIKLSNPVWHFAEDANGDVLMNNYSELYLVQADNSVIHYTSINGKPIDRCSCISRNSNGGFNILVKNIRYVLNNGKFNWVDTIEYPYVHIDYSSMSTNLIMHRSTRTGFMVKEILTGKIHDFAYDSKAVDMDIINDSLVSQNTQTGSLIYNIYYDGPPVHYLPNKMVSSVYIDKEGSFWFTTLGDGVYRLNSQAVYNIRLSKDANDKPPVFAIKKIDRNLLLGSNLMRVFKVSIQNGVEYTNEGNPLLFGPPKVRCIETLRNGYIFVGTEDNILILNASFKRQQNYVEYISVKSMQDLEKDDILCATDRNVVIIDPVTFARRDTIWNERSTIAYFFNGVYYIGSLDGLYIKPKNGPAMFAGASVPALRSRIVAIKAAPDSTIWIATSGNGVLAYKNSRLKAIIGTENGLSSNICTSLFVHGHDLWVGTVNGLNKIDISSNLFPVTQFTTADGFVSDVIYAIYADSNYVFVGTPEGMTYFDEDKMSARSSCDLRITGLTVGGQALTTDSTNFSIPHSQNNIRVDFVGISFKSGGDVNYDYRLIGLDSTWKSTRESFLNYPTLPSGSYELQLVAFNKFGVASQTQKIPFLVEKRIWEKTWVLLLGGILLLVLVWLLTRYLVRRARNQEEKKATVNKRIGELEQLALKSQMNPHFIFNSLNSIQQYVMDKDVEGANKFIAGFSHLIRQTLHFSTRQQISLAEELNYLETYLELEKVRLENAFSYAIHADGVNYMSDYFIPPMILQPYVENSVRHGVRFRKDRAGKITIRISSRQDLLTCVIEDNGVGRKASASFKSATPIEYQSKGMSLTADRIAMFNRDHQEKIEVHIEDLEDASHQATGTRVTVIFPVSAS